VWFKVHDNNDFSLLLKEDESKEEPTTKKEKEKARVELETLLAKLPKIWEVMVDDWMARYGFSEDFKRDLEDKIRIAKMQADYIINNKKHLLTMIAIKKEEMKMNKRDFNEPTDLNTILARMSKSYGFDLVMLDLSTSAYYSYLNNLIDG